MSICHNNWEETIILNEISRQENLITWYGNEDKVMADNAKKKIEGLKKKLELLKK